jgi:taurine--2-oxoglutarate transaminase
MERTGGKMQALTPEDIVGLSRRHTFWTWSAQDRVNPIPVDRAEGVYFWDTAGKRYLDFNSMVMCCNIGHGERRVIQAIAEQAQALTFAAPSMATRPRAALGRLLAEVTPPGLDRFLFTLGGAEATENAIKLARQYTSRHKVLARYRSYHGATHGAMAATGDPRRWAWEPNLMPGVVHFQGPGDRFPLPGKPWVPESGSPDQLAEQALDRLEQVVTLEGPSTIAALLLEPVPGTNGVLVPPDGYLQGVRALCDRYGILLICDEVMSGFGRTGKWFAVEHWGVVPDLMTMAKGLTSGYAPLGAVAMSEPVAAHFSDRVFQGGLTFNSHPLCLAAALANIQVIQEDGLVERAAALGPSLAGGMAQLQQNHPSVGEARSIGLFGALEIMRDRKRGVPMAGFNATSPEMEAFRAALRQAGLHAVVRWNTLLFLPPLIITEEQLAEGFGIIDAALQVTDAAALTGG